MNDGMTISQLAKAAGVNVETVRYYQRIRLLGQPSRAYGRIRRYNDGDLARLRFIKAAQRIGFSLDEVTELMKLEDGLHCTEAREIATHKLAVVRERLAHLASMEQALAGLVKACSSRRGTVRCPLIAALQGVQAE